MSRLLLCVLLFAGAGCADNRRVHVYEQSWGEASIVRVRGCEYVIWHGYSSIAHAGDCDNHATTPKSVRVRYIRPDSVTMGTNFGMVLVALDSTRCTILPAKKDLAR